MRQNNYIISIIAGIIILCWLSSRYIIRYFRKKEAGYRSLVSARSTKLNALRTLADKHHVFCNIPAVITATHFFNSKRGLDNAKYEDMLIYLADTDIGLKEAYWKLSSNRERGQAFLSNAHTTAEVVRTPLSVVETLGIPESKFYKYEEELCNEFINSFRVDATINIVLKYITPKRGDEYEHTYVSSYKDLQYAYSELNSQKIRKVQAKIERSKMSDKLRYEVLQRDHHRCVICGRGAEDGVKLHVDHIIPVSKGGKTEMSNLRVLCESCNLGKSSSYDPYGMN